MSKKNGALAKENVPMPTIPRTADLERIDISGGSLKDESVHNVKAIEFGGPLAVLGVFSNPDTDQPTKN